MAAALEEPADELGDAPVVVDEEEVRHSARGATAIASRAARLRDGRSRSDGARARELHSDSYQVTSSNGTRSFIEPSFTATSRFSWSSLCTGARRR